MNPSPDPLAAAAAPLRLVLADDHALVLAALRHLLAARPGWKVLAEAHDVTSLLALPELALADVILLDLNLPGPPEAERGHGELQGLRALPALRQRSPARVLVLSMHDDSAIVMRALHLGAHGFVTKGSPGQRLFEAIDAVRQGHTYVDPTLLGAAPAPARPVAPPPATDAGAPPAPSEQERQVGMLLLAGLTQKAIAHRLGVSAQTVHTYKKRLREKLGARNDVELLQRLAALLG
ncbi:putative transcriptional regulatory protein NarL [Tepidimonas sediminis]|uniref:Putative transcriptional regulatory protein NarL n=1 Tax=Tepidimonas sediminis TaxID=2588941 RepID=A0A554WTC6_9BURK|nr:response regulator transcription factor [Tepidimonas sediminis]TSE26784.1 putative transcriptional regulatory protein NarL [Tepidimonas sediminis]